MLSPAFLCAHPALTALPLTFVSPRVAQPRALEGDDDGERLPPGLFAGGDSDQAAPRDKRKAAVEDTAPSHQADAASPDEPKSSQAPETQKKATGAHAGAPAKRR